MIAAAVANAWLTALPQGWSSVPVALALGLVVIGYVRFGPPAQLRAKANLPLPETGWYTKDKLKKFVQAAGGRAYRRQFLWDIPFLLIIAIGLTTLLDGTFGWSLASPRNLTWVLFLPALAAASDLLEDLFLTLATRKGERTDWNQPLSSLKVAVWATAMKLAFNAAALILIVVGCIALALGGPGSWSATAFTPLVLGSVVLVIFHLAFTLTDRSELVSVISRALLAVLIFFPIAGWYLQLANQPAGEVGAALGISGPKAFWPGILWGLAPALLVVAALALISRFPAGQEKLRHPKYSNMSWGHLRLYVAGILFGTVAFEEILFRGLLFAAWGGEMRLIVAIAASSVVFGLWHIGPAIRRARERFPTHDAPGSQTTPANDQMAAAIANTVFATAAAGVFFCLLRKWSGGIWAPVLLHWVANSAGAIFAKLGRFKRFVLPASRGNVEIGLNDGEMAVADEEGELAYDGWATVDDIAEAIVERRHLSIEEARAVAAEAVRRWEEWLGGQKHRYPTS